MYPYTPIPDPTQSPPLLKRLAAMAIMSSIGLFSRAFLFVSCKKVNVTGMPEFVSLLDARRAASSGKDTCGLLTVSNHKSVLDDPVMWSILPVRYMFTPQHLRWSLGSADICFTNRVTSSFFLAGQTLPTYRLHKSPLGGLWQPSINVLPRMMDAGLWVHIFPEGRVHQHPNHDMRYFKWGIARALLESERAPVVVPVFISGFEKIMPEDRTWPRWWPKRGQEVRIAFGYAVEGEHVWGDLRQKWRVCVKEGKERGGEATKLRIEATRRVRALVEGVRRQQGWPEEEAGAADVETYRIPGMDKEEGMLNDGTKVEDT